MKVSKEGYDAKGQGKMMREMGKHRDMIAGTRMTSRRILGQLKSRANFEKQ